MEKFSFANFVKFLLGLMIVLLSLGLIGRNEYNSDQFFKLPYETKLRLIEQHPHTGAAKLYKIYVSTEK